MAAAFRGAVAIALCLNAFGAVAEAHAPLGARVVVSGEPNQATTRREDFTDCAGAVLVDPSSKPARYRFENRTKYGQRGLVLHRLPSEDPSVPLYWAPRQELTLYGERFAESPHVTQHETSIFHGSYVLVSADLETLRHPRALTFLAERYAKVRDEGDGTTVQFVVPLSQYPLVLRILSGDTRDAVAPSMAPSGATALAPTVPVTPGLVRTGRGTYYDFDRSGMFVTVYARGQSPKRISLVSSAEELAYASHAAILRRMGVVLPEKLSPVGQIFAGIEQNQKLLNAHGTPAAARGLMAYRAEENAHQYDAVHRTVPDGRWAESDRVRKRQTILWSTLRESDEYASELPPALRWHGLDSPSLDVAPIASDGHPSLVVQRPFLVFGPALAQGEAPTEIRVAETRDALHLQIAHAYLGDWTFALDRAGAIAGGILEYEFDAENPEHLVRVELVDDGLVSAATGKRRTLSAAAVAWVLRSLEKTAALRGDRSRVARPADAKRRSRVSDPGNLVLQP